MSETEVEVEDYEEIVGDLYYDDSVEAVPTTDSFQEPTLNQNVSSPQNRPILRSSNLSLAGDLQESIPKVVILLGIQHWNGIVKSSLQCATEIINLIDIDI